MHTRDETISKRAARRDQCGLENSTRWLNSVGESLKVCGDAVIWCEAKTAGVCSTKWVNCVMCVGQSPAWCIKPRWSRYHYCHLGARAVCPARYFRREFSRALPVRAVDDRHVLQCSWLPLEWDTTHTQTERERERHGGRGRGGHTSAETVSDCGVLWVSWLWSSADRGTP